ncbi:MAG TPA: hypothetical protein VMU61_13305 [Candidatus Aquilonibacter sp.]|nr:hypothetical protein [Candidatus Aquilonibacter sp.]
MDDQRVLSPDYAGDELRFGLAMDPPQITFGDKVRVRATFATESRSVAGPDGDRHGFTTPSQTRMEVIGDSTDDYAIAVLIEGQSKAMWFAENVLEFLDHQPGTTVEIGNRRMIRDEAGQWHQVELP